jgi:hypothetical protein
MLNFIQCIRELCLKLLLESLNVDNLNKNVEKAIEPLGLDWLYYLIFSFWSRFYAVGLLVSKRGSQAHGGPLHVFCVFIL